MSQRDYGASDSNYGEGGEFASSKTAPSTLEVPRSGTTKIEVNRYLGQTEYDRTSRGFVARPPLAPRRFHDTDLANGNTHDNNGMSTNATDDNQVSPTSITFGTPISSFKRAAPRTLAHSPASNTDVAKPRIASTEVKRDLNFEWLEIKKQDRQIRPGATPEFSSSAPSRGRDILSELEPYLATLNINKDTKERLYSNRPVSDSVSSNEVEKPSYHFDTRKPPQPHNTSPPRAQLQRHTLQRANSTTTSTLPPKPRLPSHEEQHLSQDLHFSPMDTITRDYHEFKNRFRISETNNDGVSDEEPRSRREETKTSYSAYIRPSHSRAASGSSTTTTDDCDSAFSSRIQTKYSETAGNNRESEIERIIQFSERYNSDVNARIQAHRVSGSTLTSNSMSVPPPLQRTSSEGEDEFLSTISSLKTKSFITSTSTIASRTLPAKPSYATEYDADLRTESSAGSKTEEEDQHQQQTQTAYDSSSSSSSGREKTKRKKSTKNSTTLHGVDDEVLRLTNELNQRNLEIIDLRQKEIKHTTETRKHRELIKQKDQQLNDNSVALQRLQEALEAKERQLNDLYARSQQIQVMEESLSRLQKEAKLKSEELNDLKNALTEKLREKDAEIERLAAKVKEKDDKIAHILDNNSQIQKYHEQLITENDELKQRLAAARSVVSPSKDDTIESLNQQIKHLKEQLDSKHATISRLISENEQIKQRNVSLTEELARSESKARIQQKKIEESHETIEKLKKENDAEFKKYERDLDIMRRQLMQQDKELQSLPEKEATLSTLTEQNEKYRSRIQQLEDQLKLAKLKIEETAKNQLAQATAESMHVTQLKEENKTLHIALRKKDAQIRDLESNQEKLAEELNYLQENFEYQMKVKENEVQALRAQLAAAPNSNVNANRIGAQNAMLPDVAKVNRELCESLVELQSLARVVRSHINGDDTNMSMILGTSDTAYDDVKKLQRNQLNENMNIMRKELESLRTLITDHYAEKIGNECAIE